MLRREFAALKPAHVPDAPTHASLVAAQGGAHDATVQDASGQLPADDVTGQAVTVRAEHPHPRRRQRRAVGPVVDPAAGRPAHRRDRRRSARARRRRHRRGRRAARARPRPGRQPRHRVPEREPADGAGHGRGRGRADRRHADLLRVLQRAVQDLLRRPGPRRAHGQARAPRRDGRDGAALAGARARAAAAVRLPARGRRAHGGVRRVGGLGQRRIRPTTTWSSASSAPPASSPTSSHSGPRRPPADPFADPTPFETLLRGA